MASNLQYHLTGGASNSDPNASLGGVGSSVIVNSTALNNLFANVTPPDIATSNYVTYRAIDLKNDGDDVAKHIEFFFEDTTNTESRVDFWYDSAGTQSIPDEETEPVGATWTQPDTDNRYSFADLPAGSAYRLWIRRTVDQDAGNLNEDTAYLNTWFS